MERDRLIDSLMVLAGSLVKRVNNYNRKTIPAHYKHPDLKQKKPRNRK